MENLGPGKFYGNSKNKFHINGLTIVDSEFYNYRNCPLHYHQNAHFAFTTKGTLIETHKTKEIQLSPGFLLYNHSQEPHYNSEYSKFVAALHIDIDLKWFGRYNINHSLIEGLTEIRNPIFKNIFHNILKEVKHYDNISPLAIEGMILQLVSEMILATHFQANQQPKWILKVKDLLYDKFNEKLSLEEIVREINIHPVYLCQQFPIYFKCSFGDYIRMIRIEKAIDLILSKPHFSLTEIAYECGFSDQSHFTRLFKKNIGTTPSAYRRMI